MKLIQKRFLKGSREFKIMDDAVEVRIKSLLKEKTSTVGLAILKPEPVVTGTELEFHGRGNRGAMLSLFLNTPNTEEFNAFVDELKQKVSEASNNEEGSEKLVPKYTRSEVLNGNVYDEPPEFSDFDKVLDNIEFKPANPARIADDIVMLKKYLNEDDIKELLASLEALKADPGNEAAFKNVVADFNNLGITQGAVLTYATYLNVLLSQSV